MSVTQMKRIELFVPVPNEPASLRCVASLSSANVIVCSQYADLRGEHDELIATVTWTSPVQFRVVTP